MDANRFDQLARTLSTASTRRGAVGALLGITLVLVDLAETLAGGRKQRRHRAERKRREQRPGQATNHAVRAAESGKCKKDCDECEKCEKGDCEKKNGKKVCKAGKCKPKDDGTPCSLGTCQNGSCIPAQSQNSPPPPPTDAVSESPPPPPPTGCDPFQCDGCCAGGVCQAGTDNALCGADGIPCEDCTARGQRCFLQSCVDCSPQNCNPGCCFADQCVVGTSASACGDGGRICDVCPEDWHCGADPETFERNCCPSQRFCRGFCCPVGRVCGEDSICKCPDGAHCCDPEDGDFDCPASHPHCCEVSEGVGICGQCCDSDQCRDGSQCGTHCPPGQRCHPFRVCVACLPPGANCATNFGCCSDLCQSTAGTFGQCA
jgi:hypothetical protein